MKSVSKDSDNPFGFKPVDESEKWDAIEAQRAKRPADGDTQEIRAELAPPAPVLSHAGYTGGRVPKAPQG